MEINSKEFVEIMHKNFGYTIVKTIDIEMLKSYILIMRGFLTIVNKVIKNV